MDVPHMETGANFEIFQTCTLRAWNSIDLDSQNVFWFGNAQDLAGL